MLTATYKHDNANIKIIIKKKNIRAKTKFTDCLNQISLITLETH